jgi:MscS family membrane protein
MAQSVTSLLKGASKLCAPRAASADPLGRDTPSGTVLGFLQAAQDGNEKAAADYLQMSAARRQSQGPDLAGKLKVLMDSLRGQPATDQHASRGQSRITASDQQTIGDFSTATPMFPLSSSGSPIRTPGKSGSSQPTRSAKFPELYDNVEAHQVENKLPQSLVRNVFLGMPLWQWLALRGDSGGFAIGWVIVLLLAIPRRLWLKFRNRPTCILTAACPSRCW